MNRSLPVALWILFASACGAPAPAVAPKAAPPPPQPAAPSDGPLLVDDFEDGNGASLLGSYWYTYVDQGNGGQSTLEVARSNGSLSMVGEGFESQHSLLGRYHLDQGKLPYSPFVGFGVQLTAKHRDLRDYAGLQYTYRGGAHEVRVETANVKQWDFHAVQLPASPTWRTVTLDFSLFRQGGWGPKVPFALEQAQALGWQVRGKTGDEGELLLDDVRLLPRDALPARVPTLELRDPEPPAPLQLGSLTITHPLQRLAEQSLDRGYNITNWLEQKRFEGYGDYDEAFVAKLAAAGFRGLRLPVDFDLYVQEVHGEGAELTVKIDPVLFSVLDDFDRWTRAHGLSLTLDYHQYDHSLDFDDPKSLGVAVALWSQLAAHFAKNPRQDLFYELLNEPELSARRGPTAEEWTKLAQRMITAIRKQDAKRPILFGDVRWYGIDELVQRRPFEDRNILYVFHFYDPFIFTHQGAPWAGMGTAHDVPYPYSKARWSQYREELGFSEFNEPWQLELLAGYYQTGNRQALGNRLALVKRWAVEHDVPILCNEFGAYESSSRQEDVLRYYRDVTGLMQELHIPWQSWFMLMDAKTGRVEPPYAEALGLTPRQP